MFLAAKLLSDEFASNRFALGQTLSAAGLGFEPRLTASKAAVLPLDDLAILFFYKFPISRAELDNCQLYRQLGNWGILYTI